MHELSITRSMLDQALAVARDHGAKRVSRIRLLLGEGGSVVPDCVRSYFEEMSKGTAAVGAELEFKKVAVRIRCPRCGAEFGKIEEMCSCNAGGELVSGQELVIESIDVD
jgi:hydrogenase nickel incorporation protein HypA/HybF